MDVNVDEVDEVAMGPAAMANDSPALDTEAKTVPFFFESPRF